VNGRAISRNAKDSSIPVADLRHDARGAVPQAA